MERTTWIIVLVCGIVLSAVSCTGYDSWMKRLPDDMPVWKVSLPGSHDAATGTIPDENPAREYAGTQTYDLATQFEAGVRCFDLRPGFCDNDPGSLRIMHGYVDAGVSAEDALGTIASMLEKHPSEFAVIVTRIENTDYTDEVLDAAKDSLSALEKKFSGKGFTLDAFRPGLTVGDLRGKMLFINRNHLGAGRFHSGASVTGWGEGDSIYGPDGVRVPIDVQDEYEWEDNDRFAKEKADCFMEHAAAFASAGEETWSVNHVSGYFFRDGLPRPHEFAAAVAPELCDRLDSWKDSASLGIVLLDYSGDPEYCGDVLVKKVIDRNFD